MPVIPDAAVRGSSLCPDTVVDAVPRAVPRLIASVSCCEVGVAAPATTPRVTRRSLHATAAAGTREANAVSTASADADLTKAEYRATGNPFRAAEDPRQATPSGYGEERSVEAVVRRDQDRRGLRSDDREERD